MEKIVIKNSIGRSLLQVFMSLTGAMSILAIIGTIIGLVIQKYELAFVLLIPAVCFLFALLLFFLTKLCSKTEYIFANNGITIIRNKLIIDEIKIEEIKEMSFSKYSFFEFDLPSPDELIITLTRNVNDKPMLRLNISSKNISTIQTMFSKEIKIK